MNDIPQPRTVQDLERKYDFSSLVKAKKEVEEQKQALNQLQRTLYGTIESLMVNLKDIIGTQDKVSLLFYDELEENKYILAENGDNIITEDGKILVDDYICLNEGDILYIRTTAKAYQYKNGELLENTDINLIQALALTNVEVGEGKERKIYLTTPSPPYSSGDWYLTNEGVLYICQLGKIETEQYEENDFILASKYTTTVAIKDGNRTTVLEGSVKILDESIKEIEGTIVEIRKNFVKFTDLLTGGSTTIAGENITTGNIQSENYIENVSGSKLSLSNGEFDSPNVKIKQDGMHLKNGAKILGDDGLISTTLIEKDYKIVGINNNFDGIYKQNIIINIIIPENYVVSSAKIKLFHTPAKWSILDANSVWGYCRNIRLYKANNIMNRQIDGSMNADYDIDNNTIYEEIIGAFGENGFTAQTASDSSHITEEVNTIDISNVFKSNGSMIPGMYQFKIETADAISSASTTALAAATLGFIASVLEVNGYKKYEEV